ncbi:MAG TPA: DapH/DapD/GlmU-related protein [Nitrososphaeraceae archaeon]|nr:DapH/DapD/GlmU-related protein [Nitrososphaeraceae archaeon]
MDISIESILSEIGIDYRLVGNIKKTFRSIATIQQGKEDDLCYCSFDNEEAVSIISKSNAGIILCKNSLKESLDQYYQIWKNNTQLRHQIILVDNPRAAFIKIINKIYPKRVETKISGTAIISESATIGSNCFIGNYAVVGKDCEIGNNTTISDRAVIVQKCKIGNNCLIEPGVTIGADGFAYERDPETLELERFPHIGGVTIGNNVEICANSSIARGSLSDTIIGDGTKLDALVHIAHNVVIGINCELTAGTIIGGSTTIGDTCWTGLNSTLKNKIKIGNKVIVGAGACVIHDVPDEDIVAGVPAKSIKDKVTSDKLFLMAGQNIPVESKRQPSHTKSDK